MTSSLLDIMSFMGEPSSSADMFVASVGVSRLGAGEAAGVVGVEAAEAPSEGIPLHRCTWCCLIRTSCNARSVRYACSMSAGAAATANLPGGSRSTVLQRAANRAAESGTGVTGAGRLKSIGGGVAPGVEPDAASSLLEGK